jgi:hypothetical protein
MQTRNQALDLSLLLGHTHSLSAAASRLGVLATNAETPVVTETPVVPDLLQALEIVTHLLRNLCESETNHRQNGPPRLREMTDARQRVAAAWQLSFSASARRHAHATRANSCRFCGA